MVLHSLRSMGVVSRDGSVVKTQVILTMLESLKSSLDGFFVRYDQDQNSDGVDKFDKIVGHVDEISRRMSASRHAEITVEVTNILSVVLDNADALVPVFNGLIRRFANQGLPDFPLHTTRRGSSFSP